MIIVPLAQVPSQTLNILLSGQAVTINLNTKFYGLFMDVLSGGVNIINGVLCLNQNYIVRSLYLGFQGDFVFWDTKGSSDPSYTGLYGPSNQNGRYQLLYLAPSELPPTYGQSI